MSGYPEDENESIRTRQSCGQLPGGGLEERPEWSTVSTTSTLLAVLGTVAQAVGSTGGRTAALTQLGHYRQPSLIGQALSPDPHHIGLRLDPAAVNRVSLYRDSGDDQSVVFRFGSPEADHAHRMRVTADAAGDLRDRFRKVPSPIHDSLSQHPEIEAVKVRDAYLGG